MTTTAARSSISELTEQQRRVEEIKELLKKATTSSEKEALSTELKKAESALDDLKHGYHI